MSEQTVGQAYVQIVPSARGISKDMQSELGGSFNAAERQGTSAFRGMFKRVAGFAALAGGAIAAAFSAKKIFGGGLDRLLNIEDAQAKLVGLGHDAASVATIMTSALNSVRGTAYGLDSAATVAAGAVAAGIQPGQELEKYLRLTADAATIAGSSMDEMGQILNRVTTSGRAQTEDLNMLADRGIPIFQWLAEEYGVTADALRDMVSRGEVDAATYMKVIEENIGGAALASGDTTRGALANMGASLARIGANLMGGVFPMFKEVFQGITTLLGPVEEGAKRVGEAFGAWVTGSAIPALQTVRAAFITLGSVLEPIIETITYDIGRALAGAFSGIDARTFDSLWSAFQGLVAAIQPLVPQILQAVSAFNPLGLIFKALLPVLPQIVTLVSDLAATLLTALTPVITTLAPILATLAQTFAGALTQAIIALLPAITGLLPVVTSVAQVLGQVLLAALQSVGPLLGMLAGVIVSLLPALTPIIGAVLGVVQALLPLISIVGSLVASLLPPLVELFMALLGPILSLIGPLLAAFVPALELVGHLVGAVVVPVVQVLATILGALLRALLPVITAILGGLVTALTTMIRWVLQAGSSVSSFVSGAISGFMTFSRRVGESILSAVQWFRDLPGRILSAVGNLGRLLYDAGRNVIQGLIDGISSMVSNIADTVGGVAQTIRDFLPFSPAKVGPLSGRGSPDRAGLKIAQMLAGGLSSGEDLIARQMTDLLSGGLQVQGSAALSVAGRGGFAAGGGVTVNVTADPRYVEQQAREMLRALQDAAATYGVAGLAGAA